MASSLPASERDIRRARQENSFSWFRAVMRTNPPRHARFAAAVVLSGVSRSHRVEEARLREVAPHWDLEPAQLADGTAWLVINGYLVLEEPGWLLVTLDGMVLHERANTQ